MGTFSFDIAIGSSGASSLRIDTHADGVRYAFGVLLLTDLVTLCGAAAKQADEEDGWFADEHLNERDANGDPVRFVSPDPMVISNRLAQLAGAHAAWGRTSAIDAACERIYADRRRAINSHLVVHDLVETTPPALVEWLASGEQAASTRAILQKMTPDLVRFHPAGQARAPRDVEAFIRCRKLIEADPVRGRSALESLALETDWSAIVAAWPHIEASMDVEHPEWRTKAGMLAATETLLRSVLQASAAVEPPA